MKLCSIASGSSGNCIYVGSKSTHIMIDTGISGKKIEQGLNTIDLTTGMINGIFITHEHSDHIKGLGVVARKHQIPIYATKGTVEAIKKMDNLGKFPEEIFHCIEPDVPFLLGDLEVLPFRISHDASEPVAYVVRHEEKSVGVATDLGKYDDYIVEYLSGHDVLLLEANHDIRMLQAGPYPYYLKKRILGERGHLSNETSGQLLCEILHDGLKCVILGHLSKENNYEELAFETVRSEVVLNNNAKDVIPIYIAKRDESSHCIEF